MKISRARSQKDRLAGLRIITAFSPSDARSARHDVLHGEVYLASWEYRVLGVTGILKDDLSPRVCWLGWTYVSKEAQQQGVGTALLRHVERLARKRKKELLISTGSDHEGALCFYKKHDYTVVATIRNYYRRGVSLIIFQKDDARA